MIFSSSSYKICSTHSMSMFMHEYDRFMSIDHCLRCETRRLLTATAQTNGRFLSPRVFSAYYTPFTKFRGFLVLINTFMRLRRKNAWDGKNSVELNETLNRDPEEYSFNI